MSSPIQVAANRLNALKSTGPRTPHGKAMTRRNALKHGVRSWGLALGPDESKTEWTAFSRAILDDLAPATPLQAMWAGRAAQLMWRLQRAARARAAIAERQWREAEMRAPATEWWKHRAANDPRFPATLHGPRDAHRDAARERNLLKKLLAQKPHLSAQCDLEINPADAISIIDRAVKHIHAESEFDQLAADDRFPGLGVLDLHSEPEQWRWTLLTLHNALTEVAELKNESLDQLLTTFLPSMDQTVRQLRSRLRRAQREAERFRRSTAAPEALDPTARFDRYESSLQISLAHALSQLRLLQSHAASNLSPNIDSSSPIVAKVGFVQLKTPENPA